MADGEVQIEDTRARRKQVIEKGEKKRKGI